MPVSTLRDSCAPRPPCPVPAMTAPSRLPPPQRAPHAPPAQEQAIAREEGESTNVFGIDSSVRVRMKAQPDADMYMCLRVS